MTPDVRSSVRRVGEAVAALGVILSLVFVGLQLRQSAVVASAQATQDLAAMSQDFLLTLGTDPNASRILNATFFGLGEVTSEEARRAQFLMIAWIRRAESAYSQVQRGLLPTSALDAYGMAEIVARFENPRFIDFWSPRRSSMSPDFVRYVEERSGYTQATR
jgi:hypothetical protein